MDQTSSCLSFPLNLAQAPFRTDKKVKDHVPNGLGQNMKSTVVFKGSARKMSKRDFCSGLSRGRGIGGAPRTLSLIANFLAPESGLVL